MPCALLTAQMHRSMISVVQDWYKQNSVSHVGQLLPYRCPRRTYPVLQHRLQSFISLRALTFVIGGRVRLSNYRYQHSSFRLWQLLYQHLHGRQPHRFSSQLREHPRASGCLTTEQLQQQISYLAANLGVMRRPNSDEDRHSAYCNKCP